MQLSLTALPLLAMLVLVPTISELALHEVVTRAVHGSGLAVELTVEWLLAAAVGGSIGVIEVALASELMARNPKSVAEGTQVGPDAAGRSRSFRR